jgi:hypothetical protein
MRIEYGLDGTWTTIRDGDVINSGNLNPTPKATDWAGYSPASVSFCQLLSTFVNICQHVIASVSGLRSVRFYPRMLGGVGVSMLVTVTGSHLVVVVVMVVMVVVCGVVWCGVVWCRADLVTKLSPDKVVSQLCCLPTKLPPCQLEYSDDAPTTGCAPALLLDEGRSHLLEHLDWLGARCRLRHQRRFEQLVLLDQQFADQRHCCAGARANQVQLTVTATTAAAATHPAVTVAHATVYGSKRRQDVRRHPMLETKGVWELRCRLDERLVLRYVLALRVWVRQIHRI